MSKGKVPNPTVFKDPIVLASGGGVLVILVAVGWLLFAGGGGEEAKRTTQRFSFMHCSSCRNELPYNPKMAGKDCEYCEGKGKFVPTVKSIEEAGDEDTTSTRVIVFVILAVVLLQGWGYLAIVRGKAISQAAAQLRNRVLVCRCPFCQRKVGYPAANTNAGITCPRCKTAFAPVPLGEHVDGL